MEAKTMLMLGVLGVLIAALGFLAVSDSVPSGGPGGIGLDTDGAEDEGEGGGTGDAGGGEADGGSVLASKCDVQETEGGIDTQFDTSAGPPLDVRAAESMLHDSINELRTSSYSVGALDCDEELRAIAQEHSEAMHDRGFFGSTTPEGEGVAERYAGVCDDPANNTVETTGRFLYQEETSNWDGELEQERNLINEPETLVRRIRGWLTSEAGTAFEDARWERQGVGMHFDREDRLLHVTHVVCTG